MRCEIWESELGNYVYLFCTECLSGANKDDVIKGWHKEGCTQLDNPAVIRETGHLLRCRCCWFTYIGEYNGSCPKCRAKEL